MVSFYTCSPISRWRPSFVYAPFAARQTFAAEGAPLNTPQTGSHRVQNPWEHSQEANPLAARALGQALSQPPAQALSGQHDGRRLRSAGVRHGAWLEHGRRGRASRRRRRWRSELGQAAFAASGARALSAGLRARLLPVQLLAAAPLRAGAALGTAHGVRTACHAPCTLHPPCVQAACCSMLAACCAPRTLAGTLHACCICTAAAPHTRTTSTRAPPAILTTVLAPMPTGGLLRQGLLQL